MLGNYPRKPLTPEQQRENDDWYRRRDAAQQEYETGKERLRASLSEKYGVQWEDEVEGDWCVEGYAPHSREPDFAAFTEEERRNYEFERSWVDMSLETIKTLAANVLRPIPSGEGQTIRWVRYGDTKQ